MRVLLGTYPAVSLLGGGVEVQVRSLARELNLLGVDAELFDPWRRYELHRYDLFHMFGAHVGTYHLCRSLRGLGVRLVVSPVFFSRYAATRVRMAVVLSGVLRRMGGIWTEQQFCREVCAMADIIMPNTQAEADLVHAAFGVPRSRLRILPNGADPGLAAATPDLFENRFGTRGFLLYVGHIGWERKNVLRMLRAVAEIDCPLVLIGEVLDNGYAEACLDLIERRPRTIRLAPVRPDDPMLASAYAACDTLILPSWYETPGLAALEAAMAGAKICITRYGGTEEYFGSHAEYLEPGSEESIRKAVRRSLDKPGDGRSLQDAVGCRYTWSRAAAILAEAYLSLA